MPTFYIILFKSFGREDEPDAGMVKDDKSERRDAHEKK